jgi:hypothetical protein
MVAARPVMMRAQSRFSFSPARKSTTEGRFVNQCKDVEWNGVHSKGMSGKQVNLTGHVFFDLHLATHLFVVMEPDRMQSGISQNAGKHLTVFSGHEVAYKRSQISPCSDWLRII